MKIVIIGDGKVGRAIVEHTVQEGHTVIVIDKNPKIIERIQTNILNSKITY